MSQVKATIRLSCFLSPSAFDFSSRKSESRAVMNQSAALKDAKHTILVLDDDSAVRDSLKFALGIEGFEVHTYSTAADLLNEDRLPASSCLIVDYHLPAMNGLEVVVNLRDRRSSMPAILITGHPDANIRERAAAAGIAVIEKPFRGTSLIDCIHAAIAGHP